MKKIVIVFYMFLFSFTFLKAHEVIGIALDLELVDEKLKIISYYEKNKKALDGNKIKIFSSLNNKLIFEGYLKDGELIVSVPKEPYYVYMYVGDDDVVVSGIPLKEESKLLGISKNNRAFMYTSFFSFLFLFMTIIIIFKRNPS